MPRPSWTKTRSARSTPGRRGRSGRISIARPATARRRTICCRRRTYRLLRGRAAFENDDHRVHYLFRVAANLLTDTHRRRPPEHVPLADVDGGENAARDTAQAMEQRTDVARALATLAPRDRDMLWLAYADGASHAEIATHLGVARPSVKVMLSRARRRLAARLHQVNAAWRGK